VSKVGEGVQTRTSRLSTNLLLMLSGASPEFLDLIKPPITPEHVLLPMTGGTSEAAEILAELGVDLEALRNDVQQVIEPEPKDWNLPKE